MTSHFLIVSVMLHFSLAVGFYSTAQQGSAATAQEIDLITLPPMERTSPKVKKARAVPTATTIATKTITSELIPTAGSVESDFQEKTIAITGSSTHPYIRNLWKSLLNKKRDIKNKLQTRSSYLVKMKITKSGFIQDINIHGPDLSVAEEIKLSLAKEPQVKSIPDDLSQVSIQVQYTVSI